MSSQAKELNLHPPLSLAFNPALDKKATNIITSNELAVLIPKHHGA